MFSKINRVGNAAQKLINSLVTPEVGNLSAFADHNKV